MTTATTAGRGAKTNLEIDRSVLTALGQALCLHGRFSKPISLHDHEIRRSLERIRDSDAAILLGEKLSGRGPGFLVESFFSIDTHDQPTRVRCIGFHVIANRNARFYWLMTDSVTVPLVNAGEAPDRSNYLTHRPTGVRPPAPVSKP